jgi:hypothetical protein
MKADLRAELGLVNRNVDEMIRLLECATDAGIWSRQDAARHTARLEFASRKIECRLRRIGPCERAFRAASLLGQAIGNGA